MNIKNIKNKVWSSASRVIDRIARRSSVFRETERRLFQVQYRADRIEVENRELAERTAAIVHITAGELSPCDLPSRRWPARLRDAPTISPKRHAERFVCDPAQDSDFG